MPIRFWKKKVWFNTQERVPVERWRLKR